jgi:hypothetical protein
LLHPKAGSFRLNAVGIHDAHPRQDDRSGEQRVAALHTA